VKADFSASPRSGTAPLDVRFSDASTGNITSRLWSFGDGQSSTATNPVHTYQSAGIFDVSLTVSGPNGSDFKTRAGYITANEPSPTTVAAFSADKTSGEAPLTVEFTDESQGDIASWHWTFGDGASSTQQNPAHTYLQAGSYTVSLTVDGPNGPDTTTATDYISVSERDNDTASVYLPALTR
jgi:PKD repeat protein